MAVLPMAVGQDSNWRNSCPRQQADIEEGRGRGSRRRGARGGGGLAAAGGSRRRGAPAAGARGGIELTVDAKGSSGSRRGWPGKGADCRPFSEAFLSVIKLVIADLIICKARENIFQSLQSTFTPQDGS